MKKKIFSLCCILLCWAAGNTAFAQVPGYMGKRFLVHYDPQMMYAFMVANHFDFYHNFSVEYVTSLKHSVNFRYGFAKLKDEYDFEQSVYASNGYQYTEDANSDIYHKVHTFTLHVKFYSKKRGYLAPTGPYTAIGFSFLHSKAVADEIVSAEGEVYSEGDAFLTDNNFALYLGKGRQFIIADRVILNMGAQLAVPFIYHLDGYGGEEELRNRVPLSYIFKVEIGVGFLAF